MTQEEFLHNIADPENHRALLWIALEITRKNRDGFFYPVAEFGAGNGSTKYLRNYCKDDGRKFFSFENNADWGELHGSRIIDTWDEDHLYDRYSVVLIDQAPGEWRKKSIERLKDMAGIIVIHDAEPDESMGYELHKVWPLFKYRVFTKGQKIWTAAVSNHYDVTKHVGEIIGDFKVEL